MKRILLNFGAGRIPPREFLIFPYGEISTRKGKFQLTEQSAASVMKLYAEHGVDIMFDYEHGGLAPQMNVDGKAPAAGSCKLALRSDGIWLTDIKWTDKASDHLRSGEYRYLSPAFNINPKTGEIVELINVALTNLPATDHIKPLVAAARLASREKSGTDRPTVALARKPMKAHPLSKHLKEHMARNSLSHDEMAEKCGLKKERMKKLADGHAPSQEEMKKCGKACELSTEKMRKLSEHKADEEASDHEADEAAARKDADEEHAIDGESSKDMAMPFAAKAEDMLHPVAGSDEVEIPHDSDEADENRHDMVPTSRRVQVKANQTEDTVTLSRETLALITGEKDPAKQGAALESLSRKAKAYDTDHDTVQALARSAEDRERKELVTLGRSTKKLTPALEKFWLKQPVSTFREFLEHAQPITALSGGDIDPLTPQNTIEGVSLSREEVEVCALMNDDPRELALFKKDMAGAEPFKMSKTVLSRLHASFIGRDIEA